MKIAVFDFCDTLVNFQTADSYVEYAIDSLNIKKRKWILWSADKFEKLTKKKHRLIKKVLLYHLKGQQESDLERVARLFYEDKIKHNLHEYVVNLIESYKKEGYEIVVSSGGYSIYIKEFCKEYGVSVLHANDFFYKNNHFKGVILAKDCIGYEKVFRLEEFYKGEKLENTVAFSDSKSDLPLLKWADRGVVISKNGHRKWCAENNLEELVLAECSM